MYKGMYRLIYYTTIVSMHDASITLILFLEHLQNHTLDQMNHSNCKHKCLNQCIKNFKIRSSMTHNHETTFSPTTQILLLYITNSNGPDSVSFLGLETKPNQTIYLYLKTKPNHLNFMKPFKLNCLEPNCLNQTVYGKFRTKPNQFII